MSDEQLAEFILKSQRFKDGIVYIFNEESGLQRIR